MDLFIKINTIARCVHTRPPIAVIEGNAVTLPLPEGKLVLFFYHSFGEELLSQLIRKLEAFLTTGDGPVFFIYYNPENAKLLDASPSFTRWYADTLPNDSSELGFVPGKTDPVVIWRSVRPERSDAPPACSAI